MRSIAGGRVWFPVLLATLATACASRSPALAQSGAPVPPGSQAATSTPVINVSASEEVEITPDRALVSLAVETRGRTAAQAGAENARIQTAVLDSLRRSGIARERIRTQGVNIMPEYQYPRDGGRPTIIGYQARNSIQVELDQVAQVGIVIDAALAKGATSVGGLSFFASNAADARRQAMKKAIERARADAEAIAQAAGGTLGALLEVTANAEAPDPRQNGAVMFRARAEAADVSTPVEAGQIRVTAFVSAKFAFVAR